MNNQPVDINSSAESFHFWILDCANTAIMSNRAENTIFMIKICVILFQEIASFRMFINMYMYANTNGLCETTKMDFILLMSKSQLSGQ